MATKKRTQISSLVVGKYFPFPFVQRFVKQMNSEEIKSINMRKVHREKCA